MVVIMDLDNLLKQLDKNDQWIQNVDVKLSIILTFFGLLSGFVVSQDSFSSLIKNENSFVEWIMIGLLGLTTLFLVIGIIWAIHGMVATIKNPHRGLWFFGDVASFSDVSNFKRLKRQETEAELKESILNQIYVTAKITNKRFQCYNKSLSAAKWAIIFFIAFQIVKFFSAL